MEGVSKIKLEHKRVKVAVSSILPRYFNDQRKNERFNMMRNRTNRLIHEGILKMNLQFMRDLENAGTSFIDMEPLIGTEMLTADGVHLLRAGKDVFGARLCQWVVASSPRKERQRNNVPSHQE